MPIREARTGALNLEMLQTLREYATRPAAIADETSRAHYRAWISAVLGEEYAQRINIGTLPLGPKQMCLLEDE